MLTTFLAILGKLRFDAKGCVCSLLVGDPELDNGLIIVNIVSINQRLPFQRERPYLGSGPTSLLTPSQEGLKDPSGTSQCSECKPDSWPAEQPTRNFLGRAPSLNRGTVVSSVVQEKPQLLRWAGFHDTRNASVILVKTIWVAEKELRKSMNLVQIQERRLVDSADIHWDVFTQSTVANVWPGRLSEYWPPQTPDSTNCSVTI